MQFGTDDSAQAVEGLPRMARPTVQVDPGSSGKGKHGLCTDGTDLYYLPQGLRMKTLMDFNREILSETNNDTA